VGEVCPEFEKRVEARSRGASRGVLAGVGVEIEAAGTSWAKGIGSRKGEKFRVDVL
jgi:hypothetical protein